MASHEETALVVSVGDAGALAQQVLRLLHDQELASKIALQARQRLEPHRWSFVRKKWLESYRDS